MEIMPNMSTINTSKLENTVKNLEKNSQNDARLKEEKQLKEVCEDFEAIFVNMMLKSGRETVSEGGLIEKSNGTKMFEGMYDEELSSTISKSKDGGMGIGKLLYEQMKLSLNRPKIEQIESEVAKEEELEIE